MCLSIHTYAHTHTHTCTLTPCTLTCSPAKTCAYTNTCTYTHRNALVHTHTGRHSLSHVCLQMHTQMQTDRHKYAFRHRHMHMHMRKHSPCPHSEPGLHRPALCLCAPDNFLQLLESPVLSREIKCQPSVVDLMTAEGFCGLDRSSSTGCVLIRGKREGVLGSKLQGLLGTFTLFTCKVRA